MISRYGERLGKTDQTASTLIVKLNTLSFSIGCEKYEFKVAQVTMAFGGFFCLFLFLTLWQHSTIWQWIGKSKQKANLKIKKSLDVGGRRN